MADLANLADKKVTKLEDLRPDPANANKGTERGLRLIEDSLRNYGAGRSILADRNGVILAGNKTLEVAAALGIPVKVIETDGQELVVVQRKDLDLESDDGLARLLAYADNRASEVGLCWDSERIANDVRSGVDLDEVFGQKDLEQLIGDALGRQDLNDAPEPEIDRTEELREKWDTKRGQLWEIGRHRLLCGDCTVKSDVQRLLDGAKPRLMVTDPPYGVEYEQEWRSKNRTGRVANDDRYDWLEAYKLSPAEVVYCWHASRYASDVQRGLEAAGYEQRAQIIWNKPVLVFSQGHYHWKHEPCWYVVRKGCKAGWLADRKQTTVWDIEADADAPGNHGTQKPLECMARPIRNHEGDVYDPFLGSGTTMVAAEQLNRTCYGIEIEPKYCAVTLERMSQMGLEPELNNA